MSAETPIDDGAAAHLVPGLALPSEALPATTGGLIDLSAVSGRSIVYVYPWNGRPGLPDPPGWDDIPGAHGSTSETEGFRDLQECFAAVGVAIFGLSLQPTAYQQELAGRLGVRFSILSDAGQKFSGALRLPVLETGGLRFLKRLTLVIADGRIAHCVYPVHPPESHATEMLKLIERIGP